jgi:hypothetical protein
VFTALLHSNESYSIVACVFIAAEMCLPSRCLAMKVNSDFAIPTCVILFICTPSLLKDAVSNTNYVASADWMTVNNEFERMWKETLVA